MTNIHFLQCVFHHPVNIITTIISYYLQRCAIPWYHFFLAVSELLSQQSCQGQQMSQAIHCTNLQTLLYTYYFTRVLGYGPETSSPNFANG